MIWKTSRTEMNQNLTKPKFSAGLSDFAFFIFFMMIFISLFLLFIQVKSYADPSSVNYVHVINSCHLDIGFAGLSVEIMDRYFHKHFPMAISVASDLKSKYNISSWNFMFQSWVVYLFLNCPNDLGLNCPSPSQKADVEHAIRSGVISYHAFPHNAELETLHPIFIEEGIRLTHRLDEKYGRALKATLSQRDVPGMSRSIIPILKSMGVNSVSVGVNTISAPPDVPRVFRWLDKNSDSELFGMWHPRGYGGTSVQDSVIFDGLEHALVPYWNGDNAGPFHASGYVSQYAKIQKEFPNAQVFPSTYDNFTQHLLDIKDKLPTVSSEIGDTWIYGIQSDPIKVSKMRAMNRVWSQFEGDRSDPNYLNATFWALKNGEHTWGRDVKSNLADNTNWTNANFHAAKAANVAGYGKLEKSWIEQRIWGIETPLKVLSDAGDDSLLPRLKAEFDSIDNVATPTLDTPVPNPADPLSFGRLAVKLNPTTGAISSLQLDGQEWLPNDLFSFVYHVYNTTDYDNFLNGYASRLPPPGWAEHDFGKPNLPKMPSTTYNGTLGKVWRSEKSLLLEIVFPKEVVSEFGGAEQTFIQFDFEDSTFNITATFINKTSTRLPESMHIRMHASPESVYRVHKLNGWVDPLDVVSRGAKRLHGVQDGISQTYDGKGLMIDFVDSALVAFGGPDAFPTPIVNETSDVLKYGANAILWDNLWGTNYIMWYPFANYSADIKYRFSATLSKE